MTIIYWGATTAYTVTRSLKISVAGTPKKAGIFMHALYIKFFILMNFPKGSSHLNRLMIEIKGLGNKSKISKCTEKNSL